MNRYTGSVVLIVAAAIALTFYLTAPTPVRKPARERLPLITAQPASRVDHALELTVHGRAEPVTQITLAPQVGGQVVATHPNLVPGGYIPARATIVQIDSRDYSAAVRSAEAALAMAREELRLEEGRQRAALAEWQQFGRAGRRADDPETERDLATRGPQLRSREAAVQSAEAALQRAQLDLERTRVRIPQPVIIDTVGATVGTLAQPGQSLGRAYPADRLFIRGALPTDQLHWLAVGVEDGVSVWPSGAATPISGTVREVAPSVQQSGSLGEFVVEVAVSTQDEPNGRVELPVRAGEFVRMSVGGTQLQDVFVIPRDAFHRDREIWVVDDGRLRIQQVTPLYKGPDEIVLREGLEEGVLVVTSQLAQPVDGMRVRVAEPANEGLEQAERNE